MFEKYPATIRQLRCFLSFSFVLPKLLNLPFSSHFYPFLLTEVGTVYDTIGEVSYELGFTYPQLPDSGLSKISELHLMRVPGTDNFVKLFVRYWIHGVV